jgi:fluoride exporter
MIGGSNASSFKILHEFLDLLFQDEFIGVGQMNEQLVKIGFVLIGGGLGSGCRYGASLMAVRLFGSAFAWGTLAVNLVGCLLIGLIFSLTDRTNLIGPLPRLFFVTGFLGGLTTFSSYALETAAFIDRGTSLIALSNFASNNVLGLVLVFAGMWIGRLI